MQSKKSHDNITLNEDIKNPEERKLIEATLHSLVELKKGFQEKSYTELKKFLNLFVNELFKDDEKSYNYHHENHKKALSIDTSFPKNETPIKQIRKLDLDYSRCSSKHYLNLSSGKKFRLNEQEKSILEKVKQSLKNPYNFNFDSVTDELLEHISRKYKEYSMKIRLFEVSSLNSPVILGKPERSHNTKSTFFQSSEKEKRGHSKKGSAFFISQISSLSQREKSHFFNNLSGISSARRSIVFGKDSKLKEKINLNPGPGSYKDSPLKLSTSTIFGKEKKLNVEKSCNVSPNKYYPHYHVLSNK